ncbi:Uncharacterized protein ESCO_001011 [Escovopsis weberi]|uniref:Uncharacterized protein n=1 Tax=Escovopsis weberi TaxID=150374 RepID=A0A0M8N2T6_ESCWE|nr:Uncharacterized protein ESCO_001011 [Escovopsis weberi]
MNRPRNRQPRPPRRGNPTPSPRPPAAAAVPSTALVVPGAPVFIVLKADQPTDRETRGVVQDVLTAGNHPRGIKVRLRDGQVGRVQRMDAGLGHGPGAQTTAAAAAHARAHAYTDVREDGYLEGPPERNLADYFAFEGDEAAVTHHVEREHLG